MFGVGLVQLLRSGFSGPLSNQAGPLPFFELAKLGSVVSRFSDLDFFAIGIAFQLSNFA